MRPRRLPHGFLASHGGAAACTTVNWDVQIGSTRRRNEMTTQTPTKQEPGTGQRLDYAAAEGLTETEQPGLAEESWRTWTIFAIAGTALLALIAVIFGVVPIAQADKEPAPP